jgi:arylformamidase
MSTADADDPFVDTALTEADRERAYSPSSCIGGDYQPFVEAYARQSMAAREQAMVLGARWLEVKYGSALTQRMDLCVPPRRNPSLPLAGVLVFIHGGYWQELSAAQSLFAAAECARRGLAFCAIDYTLAPAVGVAAIVEECREALCVLAEQAPSWGVDPRCIVVAGHSAGAHLAAMACLPQWSGMERRGFEPLGTVLVSGIYDLTPLVGTSINEALGLNVPQARSISPAFHSVVGFPPSVVAWGEIETEAFKQQSQRFAEQIAHAGAPCTQQEIHERNHFDVILDLANPDTALGRLTLDLFASV